VASNSPKKPSRDLELVVGGVRVASIVFSIVAFTREPFQKQGPALRRLQSRFFELCPEATDWHFATENMSRHKPTTNRTFSMLDTWTKSGAPPREFVALEIKDGEVFKAAPHRKFQVLATEPGSTSYDDGDANMIVLSFPVEWAVEHQTEMETLSSDVFSSMPMVSGHAGYAYELSTYFQSGAETHAWRHSTRRRGIDIIRPAEDRRAVGPNGLKTVSWLTMIGTPLVKQLGGDDVVTSHLGSGIDLQTLPTGIVFKAGDTPQFGDIAVANDLPTYRDVFRRVRPLIENVVPRYPPMGVLTMLRKEVAVDWLFRLDRNRGS
jgi:hypothetical protein